MDNFTEGLDIHLFVEYVLRYGNLQVYDAPHVCTNWGRAYAMHLADVREGLPYVEYSMHDERYIYFNKIVDSLASTCNMENTRISVTVFNSNELAMLQSATNNINLLRSCTSNTTFVHNNNGGKVCAGWGIRYSRIEVEDRLGDYILRLTDESPNRKHVVLFVSELFPICEEYAVETCKEIFNKWKMNNVEFITLRLNNPCVIYSYNKLEKPMNYEIYKELSTVP